MNDANIPQNGQTLKKCPTGIDGLDQITFGGLPQGKATLICGGPGCGKTLFALQFLIHGAEQHGAHGVFISFEERISEVLVTADSVNLDLKSCIESRQIHCDYIDLNALPFNETGEFDLEGLFLRIESAVRAVDARLIAFDNIGALFGRFSRHDILRLELARLYRWLKDQGLTTIVTSEIGDNSLSRFGIEEYLADSVIRLDHRMDDQVATRRLRILKYRGSAHGTNEYPYTISATGLSILPITSLTLDYSVSLERISSGVPRLDTMLEGKGYYRGSSVLISGTAGTGKTSLAVAFSVAACQRGERVLYFAYEEAASQISRNLRSIGLDLAPIINAGKLKIIAQRATTFGLETHLGMILNALDEFRPSAVVIDPISNLISIGSGRDVKAALTRLVDQLKHNLVTSLFTDLSGKSDWLESTSAEISSLMDTWLMLRDIEHNGERNRGLYVLKSRGMAHSNQIRELKISSDGLDLLDVYIGSGGVLTGTARIALEARERSEQNESKRKLSNLLADLEERKHLYELQKQNIDQEFKRDLRSLEDAIAACSELATERLAIIQRLSSMRGQDDR